MVLGAGKGAEGNVGGVAVGSDGGLGAGRDLELHQVNGSKSCGRFLPLMYRLHRSPALPACRWGSLGLMQNFLSLLMLRHH